MMIVCRVLRSRYKCVDHLIPVMLFIVVTQKRDCPQSLKWQTWRLHVNVSKIPLSFQNKELIQAQEAACAFQSSLETTMTSSHAFSSMMTSSNGNIFRVTGPLCGEFTGHRWIPLTKASDVELWCFFDLRLNKRLSKQSWGWWLETPSCSLWRYCNGRGRDLNCNCIQLWFRMYIESEFFFIVIQPQHGVWSSTDTVLIILTNYTFSSAVLLVFMISDNVSQIRRHFPAGRSYLARTRRHFESKTTLVWNFMT